MLVVIAAALAGSPQCAPVDLALLDRQIPATFRGKPFRETSANFRKAYALACSEGLLAKNALVPGRTKRLFLTNAPNANVASIYMRSGQALLEYPFVSDDKQIHVPSTDELHEAIYCAVHGASGKEQEESGRCLPD